MYFKKFSVVTCVCKEIQTVEEYTRKVEQKYYLLLSTAMTAQNRYFTLNITVNKKRFILKFVSNVHICMSFIHIPSIQEQLSFINS